jgi:hypothetical protein
MRSARTVSPPGAGRLERAGPWWRATGTGAGAGPGRLDRPVGQGGRLDGAALLVVVVHPGGLEPLEVAADPELDGGPAEGFGDGGLDIALALVAARALADVLLGDAEDGKAALGPGPLVVDLVSVLPAARPHHRRRAGP